MSDSTGAVIGGAVVALVLGVFFILHLCGVDVPTGAF